MATNVPIPTFGDNGFVAPAESAILAGVQQDQQQAFGGDLNPALTTPQGQLATSLTAIIGDCDDQFLALANGVDPAFASGRMQDAIARIYFIERNPAEPTSVVVTCTGLAETIIPVGARAQDQNGNIYVCTEAGTIPVSGSIDLTFANTVNGPIACPAGQLNKIYQAIPGWDTVSNANDGALGTDVESRADFEERRIQSVALNSKQLLPSVRAAVLNVPNVLDVFTDENPGDTPIMRGTYTLAAHSIYVGVAGGAAADIAQAIWTKKGGGCNYNGNTTITVQDTEGYDPPFPSYQVTFQTLTSVPILFAVQIANVATLPSNVVQLIQNAIVNQFTGANGSARQRAGQPVFAGRYYPPVLNVDPSVEVLSLLIGTTTANQAQVAIGIDQIPSISAANISVTLV